MTSPRKTCTRCGIIRTVHNARDSSMCRDCIDVTNYQGHDVEAIMAARESGATVSDIARDQGISRHAVGRVLAGVA